MRVECPKCGRMTRVRKNEFFYKHASVYGRRRKPGANNPVNFCPWGGKPAKGYGAALALGVVTNRADFDARGFTDEWTPGKDKP